MEAKVYKAFAKHSSIFLYLCRTLLCALESFLYFLWRRFFQTDRAVTY